MQAVSKKNLDNQFPLSALGQIFKALQQEKDACDPAVLMVGGCVRNMILSMPITDIDIATIWTPDEVQKKLERENIKVIPTGVDHGTVTAVIKNTNFEITTLRIDNECDGRHAAVSYGVSWLEDARRRDFTMNALYMDLEGQIYDPLTTGVNDTKEHNVRFVGNAAQRITEDALRILRFFRFFAYYGQGAPDKDALKACEDHASLLTDLSKERITQEMLKILQADLAANVLGIMRKYNVLKYVFDDIGYDMSAGFTALERLGALQLRYDLMSAAARIAVLCPARDNIDAFSQSILLSNKMKKEILSIQDSMSYLPKSDLSDKTLRACCYYHGRSPAIQGYLVHSAMPDNAMAQSENHIKEKIEMLRDMKIPDFPITGEDLIANGFAQGPALGQELRRIEKWWVAQDFRPDRDECLSMLE
jgi:poly(A) polymerase